MIKKIGHINSRTRNVMVNTMASGIMKVCSMVCSFIIVPITIDYLNPENYGVWMAITSILYWIAFCDIGLGNGMRNYMAEAIAKEDWSAAQSYFSTALFFLSVIAMLIGVVSIPWIYVCDLNALFNTQSISPVLLANTLMVAVTCSLIQFIVKCIGMVYIALQKYAYNDIILFLGNISSVIAVFILTKTTEGNLLYVVISYMVLPIMFFLLAAIPLLNKYPALKPCFQSVNIDAARKVVFKGLGFFVIQLTSCLVIFGSANVFMSHYCGPEQVTVYNVAYKVFFVLTTIYTISLSPLWNAYTDAAVKGDFVWIKKTFWGSFRMWILTSLGGLVLLSLSGWLYKIWIGDSVIVPFSVSVCVMLYIFIFNLNNWATYLINGFNKIYVQIVTSIVATALYLVAVYVIKGSWGIVGISACMVCAYLFMAVIHIYQCYLFINNKAKGIWNK